MTESDRRIGTPASSHFDYRGICAKGCEDPGSLDEILSDLCRIVRAQGRELESLRGKVEHLRGLETQGDAVSRRAE